jgi:hypothetical protein
LIYDNATHLTTNFVSIGNLSATGSKLSVFGNTSIGSTYGSTAAPTNGLIVEGNVGIGTTNPSTILTLSKPIDASAYGSGSRAIDFKVYLPGYDVNTVKASIYVGVSKEGTLQTTKGYLAFLTSATSGSENLTEKMRIESPLPAEFTAMMNNLEVANNA